MEKSKRSAAYIAPSYTERTLGYYNSFMNPESPTTPVADSFYVGSIKFDKSYYLKAVAAANRLDQEVSDASLPVDDKIETYTLLLINLSAMKAFVIWMRDEDSSFNDSVLNGAISDVETLLPKIRDGIRGLLRPTLCDDEPESILKFVFCEYMQATHTPITDLKSVPLNAAAKKAFRHKSAALKFEVTPRWFSRGVILDSSMKIGAYMYGHYGKTVEEFMV